MTADKKRLDALIEDLNTSTFIDEPWFVEFIDSEGELQIMGNQLRFIKSGIWISALRRDLEVNPRIRTELVKSQCIIRVCCFGVVTKWGFESMGEQ